MKYYFLSFGVSLLLSALAVPVLIRIARKFNILDHPSTDIKTHKKPVPYLGGLGIAFAFFFTLILIRYLTDFPTGTLRNLRGIFIGGGLILAVGMIDDLKVLHYKNKFIWQILSACALVYFGIRIDFLRPLNVSYLFSIFWIVAIINSVNILDVMDGLSSGAAVIAALFFFLINPPNEEIYVNFTAIALAGALLGFWIFNKPEAKIYMGDAGSLFTGFILAALSLGTKYSTVNDIALYGPILILGIPIYETVFVMWARYSKDLSIFLGSKDHFSIRLRNHGWSKNRILMYTYLAGITLGLAALVITRVNLYTGIIIYSCILVCSLVIARKLYRIQ